MNKIKKAIILGLIVMPAAVSGQSYLAQYGSAYEAQQHCPYDKVEQIDSRKALSPIKGQAKNSDSTKGYVCRQDAIVAGYGGLITHLQPLPKH